MSVKSTRPPASQPPPQSPTDILIDMHKRLIRIETRLGRFMEHSGLNSRGDPLSDKPAQGR